MAQKFLYIPNRVIDSEGISSGATFYFYETGTSVLADIYSDEDLTTPAANPMTVNAGAVVPEIYYSPDVILRVRTVYADGSVDDQDPWDYLNAGDISFAQDDPAATNRSVEDKLRERVSVDDFLQTGDVDDTQAIIRACNYLASTTLGTGDLLFGDRTYTVSSMIEIDTIFGSLGVRFYGTHPSSSSIATSADITVFRHQENFKVSNLAIRQTGTAKTGKAFATSTTGQATHCSFEDVDIIDFRFGFLWRYSLWSSFKNVSTYDCAAGFRLARNDDMEDSNDPVAAAYWNLTGGWFHNQLVFENIKCEGGEVGIWGSIMGSHFDGVTCQGQSGTGADNVVLPVGGLGTGIYLEGGNDTDNRGWQNVLTNFYAENTRRPLLFEDMRDVLIDGAFFQGSSVGSPFKYAIQAVSSKVEVRGVTGQDYFESMAKLETGSEFYGLMPGFGTVATYDADSTSTYRQGMEKEVKKRFQLTKANGVASAGYTLPVTLQDGMSYHVDVVGIRDGTTLERYGFAVSRWTSDALSQIDKTYGDETNIAATITGGQVRLTLNNIQSMDLRVVLTQMGETGIQTISVSAS